MKKKVIIPIIILAIVGIIFYYFKKDSTHLEAKSVKVEKTDIDIIVTATGTIEPTEEVEVGTQVSGTIEKIYVDFNSQVQQNQLLAELDKSTLETAVIQAKASYDAARNEQLYYQKNYSRQNNLYKQGVISLADYELATYQYNNANQSVTQRKSDLERASTNLGYANIYSPVNGIIVSKDVEVGQTVAASYSTPTLFKIAKDLTKMQVEAKVDEADIGKVKIGQRVTFAVDAFPQEVFNGEVNQIRLNAATESNVVTYTVVITADNDDLKLKPGLTATVSIYAKELSQVNSIAAKAANVSVDNNLLQEYCKQENIPMPTKDSIKEDNSGKTKILLVRKKNVLGFKKVELGENDGVNIEVISGLIPEDEVIYEFTKIKNSEAKSKKSPFMPQRKKGSKGGGGSPH